MTERRITAIDRSAASTRGIRFASDILEKERVRTTAIIEQVNAATAFHSAIAKIEDDARRAQEALRLSLGPLEDLRNFQPTLPQSFMAEIEATRNVFAAVECADVFDIE